MPFSMLAGPALALLALSNLSIAAMPLAAPGIFVAVCGSPGMIELPLDGSPPRPKNDCSSACHALCTRKKLATGEEA